MTTKREEEIVTGEGIDGETESVGRTHAHAQRQNKTATNINSGVSLPFLAKLTCATQLEASPLHVCMHFANSLFAFVVLVFELIFSW